jgi:hypothetical protein
MERTESTRDLFVSSLGNERLELVLSKHPLDLTSDRRRISGGNYHGIELKCFYGGLKALVEDLEARVTSHHGNLSSNIDRIQIFSTSHISNSSRERSRRDKSI